LNERYKMTAKQKSTGKCCFCGGEFGKSVMAKHIKSCDKRRESVKKAKAGPAKTFLIRAEGRYQPEYWLLLGVKADARLKDLDNFLRDIWLECCGHMSSFQIEGIEYGIDPTGEFGMESMNTPIEKVLETGTKFYHQYDFGSTTELALKVITEQQGSKADKSVKLLARNNSPEINCQLCGNPATQICTECLWSDKDAVFCDKCADSHECDSEMYLPVVNSPRVGVCGYTG